jgi:DNA-binding CsgD family transcriptional regulator
VTTTLRSAAQRRAFVSARSELQEGPGPIAVGADASVTWFRLGGVECAVLSCRLPEGRPLAELTPAENEVARLAVEGHSSAEIAALRGTSVRTVDNQLGSIYTKLGLNSRAELAVLMARRGSG